MCLSARAVKNGRMAVIAMDNSERNGILSFQFVSSIGRIGNGKLYKNV